MKDGVPLFKNIVEFIKIKSAYEKQTNKRTTIIMQYTTNMEYSKEKLKNHFCYGTIVDHWPH